MRRIAAALVTGALTAAVAFAAPAHAKSPVQVTSLSTAFVVGP